MRDFVVLINLDEAVSRSMARRLRSERIYCRVLAPTVTAEEVLRQNVRGVIIAAASTGVPAELPHLLDFLQSGLPMLCMGDSALTLAELLGGTLTDLPKPGGVECVRFDHTTAIFEGMEDGERYLHAIRYMTVPAEKATPAAVTEEGALGIRVVQRDVWGLALQLERNDPGAMQLLMNFCLKVCGCTQWWTNQAFIDQAKEEIQQAAAGGDAICALSGGGDSGVCALLGHMALGTRLHCIFVDTGLMRKGEVMQVMDFYSNQIGLNLRRVDATEEFLAALAGVTDPKEKERIIFQLLRDVLCREAAAIPGVKVMIQGTIYTDVIKGVQFPMSLPDAAVVEPVRELFKDEVRCIGEELGMTPAMLLRQPFPGSGLASRILTDVTRERLAIVREADAIFRYEIQQNNQHKRLWQYFAALACEPEADGYVITLRAVQSVDGTGGMAARLPNDLLERVTVDILSRCPQVSRVMYDLTPSKTYMQSEHR